MDTIGLTKRMLSKHAVAHIWVISDLQQAIPEKAKYCLDVAIEDYKFIEANCQKIWYLGDSVEGDNLNHIIEMTKMQLQRFRTLNIPLNYVMGNHDFDFTRSINNSYLKAVMPFYEAVKRENSWKTTKTGSSMYFTDEIADYKVFFLSDHIGLYNQWLTTHGRIRYGQNEYPYKKEDYLRLRQEMESCSKKVITASHYSYPGGSRPSELFGRFLPLPSNVKLHFYGHAHIGDVKWAKESCYQKISYVDYQNVPQINVSSLENQRGSTIRSVFVDFYDNNSVGIYFRDHQNKRWTESYILDVNNNY